MKPWLVALVVFFVACARNPNVKLLPVPTAGVVRGVVADSSGMPLPVPR